LMMNRRASSKGTFEPSENSDGARPRPSELSGEFPVEA